MGICHDRLASLFWSLAVAEQSAQKDFLSFSGKYIYFLFFDGINLMFLKFYSLIWSVRCSPIPLRMM